LCRRGGLRQKPSLEYEYVAGGDLVGVISGWHRAGKPPLRQVNAAVLSLAKIVAHALDTVFRQDRLLPCARAKKPRSHSRLPVSRANHMRSTLFVLAVSVATLALTRLLPAADPKPASETKAAAGYAQDVAPFLSKYCVECHRGNRAKARVRLDGGYDALMKASRKGKPLVAAGEPDRSVLLLCVSGSGFKVMPPRKYRAQPGKEEIETVRAWIAAGARKDS
jgi:mono/diheme cytochrome c family protein